MTTLSTRPLPPAPSLRPDYLKTYDIILNAERHAVQQVENSSSDQGAKQNLIYARVVGYLLLELFDRRMILSDGPCESLVKQLTSLPRESGDPRDVVFRVGKLHRDSLLRMCALGFFSSSFGILVSMQFEHQPGSTQHLPCTPRVLHLTRWKI